MATKRPHPSSEVHPSRREQVPAESRVSKKRKQNPHPGRSLQPKQHPINPLKSRIRSLQRLLDHDQGVEKGGMGADIRIGMERELKSLEWQLAEAQTEEARRRMIGRWHMVRFFDRQKATRRLKKAERMAKDGADEDGKRAVHRARVDLNYAQYFPLDQPYSSLWPTGKKGAKGETEDQSEADEDSSTGVEKLDESQGDREMWELVERCMADGKLADLRKGKIVTDKPSGTSVQASTSGPNGLGRNNVRQDSKLTKKEREARQERSGKAPAKKRENKADDEDSDGGFFE